ncbi:reverse transcriptase domain-containing protein [Tanacetum coccineum]|uniref:Reverse transcriptase domain-containing protein n=1 Tax=Tanacetum coccineum TaxID=301880 RepID=A0ABQ5DUN2_9ASTR
MKPKRKDTEVPQPSGPTNNVADEAVYEEMNDRLERAVTTATSLDAEQYRDNINKTQSKATLNEPSFLGTSSVKKLEKKGGSRTHKLKRLYKVGLSRRVESSDEERLGEEDTSKQGRIADIDADAGINLVSTHFDADTDMFGVHDLVGDEVVVETEVASKDVNLSVDEVTLAQALAALKSAKPKADKVMLQEPEQGTITTTAATTVTAASTRPKAKGLVIHEEEQATTPTVSSQQPSQVKVQDKGKEIMVEEPDKPIKKKELIRLDEEIASKLQAKFDEEVRLAREKDFAAIRAKEKRNKPPTKEQKKNIMSTYLKNIAGYKQNQLKNKSFDDIQKLFDKAMKRVNTFVDMDTELVEGSEVRAEAETTQESSSKRAGTELEQESIKKQKVDEDKETAELQRLIEVVPDKEEVAIDAIPLATKPPSIVDYKIHKEGKKTYYQIIRGDGSSKMYLVFSHMLKSFDSEDLETLWELVKAKHGSTRLEEGIRSLEVNWDQHSSNFHSDTGANSHVTPDLEAMDISEAYYSDDAIHVGNGNGLTILHIGSSKVYSPQKTFSLKNILHVPKISHNLLSVKKCRHDNDVFFEFHTSYFVVKEEYTHTTLLTGPSKHGLYTITLPQLKSINKVYFSVVRDSPTIWHKRLRHPHQRLLLSMLSNFSLSVTNKSLSSFYNSCPLGKSSKLSLFGSVFRSKNIIDLVYCDVWGPPPLLSFEEIIHRRSCPHTSEQNGFVERRNRYVMETDLTLLAQACVPQRF